MTQEKCLYIKGTVTTVQLTFIMVLLQQRGGGGERLVAASMVLLRANPQDTWCGW